MGHSAVMNYVFPTRHQSPPVFCHKGSSQSSSSKVLHIFCIEGRKLLGDGVPKLGALPAAGTGAQPPSQTTTAFFRVSAEAWRWAPALLVGTWPAHWIEPALSTMVFDRCHRYMVAGLGKETTLSEIRTAVVCKITLGSAEKVSKQAIPGCWQSGCVVSVLQVWAWLMRKLWREVNSLSTWLSQPFLTCVGLGTDGVQHRDCTAWAVQVTDEYQGSKMLLLDLSAVFDALRYCWVAFDPQQE